MRTRSMMIAALVAAGAISLNAQTPERPPQQPPKPPAGDTTQRTAATDQVITVSGCLKEEKDVPGARPNVAERAGITEDYVLTNVKMAQSSTTSGIGLASAYEVKGIAEAELKKHLNHQVEVTGRLATGDQMGNRGAAAAAGSAAAANADLPDLQATSIKMIAAACPAAQ